MKPTSLIYLHKISHLVQKFGHSSGGARVQRQKTSYKELENQGFFSFKFLDYIENCHIWDVLSCIALLVKHLYKLDYIWGK